MDCSEVKELLSAYDDNELPSDMRNAVAVHLESCDECANEQEYFRRLSLMAKELVHPEPPVNIWQQLEEKLEVEYGGQSERLTWSDWLSEKRKPLFGLCLATAAALFIAVGWIGSRYWVEHGDHEMAAVFEEYLEEFNLNPVKAQQILLSHYQGQMVDAEQAIHTVGYRPVVADGMPEGFSIGKTYVMKMPCCTCVQCLCQRSDGTTLAIFEHDDDEPDWFGSRAEQEMDCDGTHCNMVNLDKGLAASWKRGKRYITIIGKGAYIL